MWTAGLYRKRAVMCTRKGVFVRMSLERVPENGILGTYRTAGEELRPGLRRMGLQSPPLMEAGKFAL